MLLILCSKIVLIASRAAKKHKFPLNLVEEKIFNSVYKTVMSSMSMREARDFLIELLKKYVLLTC
jgi:hypothetical protein